MSCLVKCRSTLPSCRREQHCPHSVWCRWSRWAACQDVDAQLTVCRLLASWLFPPERADTNWPGCPSVSLYSPSRQLWWGWPRLSRHGLSTRSLSLARGQSCLLSSFVVATLHTIQQTHRATEPLVFPHRNTSTQHFPHRRPRGSHHWQWGSPLPTWWMNINSDWDFNECSNTLHSLSSLLYKNWRQTRDWVNYWRNVCVKQCLTQISYFSPKPERPLP